MTDWVKSKKGRAMHGEVHGTRRCFVRLSAPEGIGIRIISGRAVGTSNWLNRSITHGASRTGVGGSVRRVFRKVGCHRSHIRIFTVEAPFGATRAGGLTQTTLCSCLHTSIARLSLGCISVWRTVAFVAEPKVSYDENAIR